jgi:hypothetical protein
MIPSEPWPCPECGAALASTDLGDLLLCPDPTCKIGYYDPGVGRWPCPECGAALAPTKVGSRILRCPDPTCQIGWWDPIANRGMFKMPSLPAGTRWISKGEGLTAISETVPADAPLPEGWREGMS